MTRIREEEDRNKTVLATLMSCDAKTFFFCFSAVAGDSRIDSALLRCQFRYLHAATAHKLVSAETPHFRCMPRSADELTY